MGFNILRFKHNETIQWGVQKGNSIAPFGESVNHLAEVLANHLDTAKELMKNNNSGTIDLEAVKIVSPVTKPTRLLCLGLNYYDHREEAQADTHSKETVFFRKDESAIIGANDDIQWPKGCQLLDYEVELGLVMKKAIHQPTTITKENISEYVAGMILVNDMSPRDIMFFNPFSQWYKGKSWRCMCPMGSYIHIFEEGEIHQLYNMEIKLWVNDDLRQNAHTKDMITPPEKALTIISEAIDLDPGDVFLTGTPGGVAAQAPPKKEGHSAVPDFSNPKVRKMMVQGQLKSGRFLKNGDIVRCSLKSADGRIDGGTLVNRIVG